MFKIYEKIMDKEMQHSTTEVLPPGTQRIESSTGSEIILSPLPSLDPNQPLNWPKWRKTLHMVLLCLYTILVFAVLTAATPLWISINLETGVDFADLNNAYASSSGALAIGCIFFVPLALKFGRRPVYIATALLMTVSAIWQGRSQTVGDFIGSNVIAGLAGAVNEALFQVTVTDLYFVHQRASANGVYLASVCLGNYLAPVAAGYIDLTQGWRWTFYYLTIFMGIVSIAMIFALEESKYPAPAIHGQAITPSTVTKNSIDFNPSEGRADEKTATTTELNLTTQATRQSTLQTSPIPMNNYWKRHRLYTIDVNNSSDSKNTFFRHILQPFQILIAFPVVAFAALQYGWLVSILSVVAVTQATIYPASPYNFSPAAVGLMSLPPAIGAVLGSMFGGPLVDYFSVQVAKRRGGIHEPETRLWLFMVPGCASVIGCLMYGLTVAEGMPWIINAIGAGFTGFALGGCGDMALTYLQDSYQYILGDALVGVVFVRNAISTGMIFAVPPWMTNMGTYNMFVVVGVISAVIALTCVPLIVRGRKWRIALADTYQKYADRQY